MSITIGDTKLYCREPERWRKALTRVGLADRANPEIVNVPNGTILPMRWIAGSKGRFVDGLLEGGVIDEKGSFVAGLKRSLGAEPVNRTCANGYPVDSASIEERDEDVVYGGVLAGAWGHMLVDATSRLWYAKEARDQNLKVIFSIIPDQKLAHSELLHLAGLPEGSYEIIERPTRFRGVTIPASSVFLKSGQFTDRWIQAFNQMRDNALAAAEPKSTRPNKIYLSRTQYEYQNVVGEEYFERFFANHGYTPVYLEQLSLPEQVATLANAESVATTMGTLAHMALFCKNGTELIILNRSRTVVDTQAVINSARQLRCTLVDVCASFLPDRQTTGCPVLIAPGPEWEEFVLDRFGDNPDPTYRNEAFPAYAIDYAGKWGEFYATQWGFEMIRNSGMREVVALTNEVFNGETIDLDKYPEPAEIARLRNEVSRLRMQIDAMSQNGAGLPEGKTAQLLDSIRVDAASWDQGLLAIGGILAPTKDALDAIALTVEEGETPAELALVSGGLDVRLCAIKLERASNSTFAWSAAIPERGVSNALTALYSKTPFDTALLAIRIELETTDAEIDILPIGADCTKAAAHSFWKHNIRFGAHAARSRWEKGGAMRFDTVGIKDLASAVRKRLR